MRKDRALVLGVPAAGVVAGAAGVLVHAITTGSAATAFAICAVGLGPAFAAVALVAAVSTLTPPNSAGTGPTAVQPSAEPSDVRTA